MNMSHLELRRKWKELFPYQRHIWLFDTRYQLFEPEMLKKFIPIIKNTVVKFPDGREVTLDNLYNVSPVFDCEDFAFLAIAIQRLYTKLLIDEGVLPSFPVPFGMVAVGEYRGIVQRHAINCAVTSKGLFFIDFSDSMVRGRKWKANPEYDHPFFTII